MTEELTSLLKPLAAYPFLLIHVGTDDAAQRNYEEITPDFEALGRKLKDFETQIVLCPFY